MQDLKSLKIISILSQSLPITEKPFRLMAENMGIDEKRLLFNLKEYKRKKIIRRFGAVLNHRRIGLKANALVCWKTKDVDKIGKILASYSEISHCYLRRTYPFWPYNLYTMIHAENKSNLLKIIKSISKKIRIYDYRILYTLKEFKKKRQNLGKIKRVKRNEIYRIKEVI
ncbi:MAG: Lrp/AsnC family transcriptional regulator [Candidatus Omnitrophica bacterium]|nr:Lrp/AsnC family transcriptional regulator [Candidatus Omnitrophota bacterium]